MAGQIRKIEVDYPNARELLVSFGLAGDSIRELAIYKLGGAESVATYRQFRNIASQFGEVAESAVIAAVDAVATEKGLSAKNRADLKLLATTGVFSTAAVVGVKGGGGGAAKTLADVPGRVQSRINLTRDGMSHLALRHLSGKENASQFFISENEIRRVLQSNAVVNTPVTRIVDSIDGVRYVREVDIGRSIGVDKFSAGQSTSLMTVMTDKFGNLVTAFPGVLK